MGGERVGKNHLKLKGVEIDVPYKLKITIFDTICKLDTTLYDLNLGLTGSNYKSERIDLFMTSL
jgi:hypothetical protein